MVGFFLYNILSIEGGKSISEMGGGIFGVLSRGEWKFVCVC